ncbi:histone-lysine N-methyltransferase SETMAR-like isoform X2 [Hylaeus volcanicus]|uniref:histone-lysine N-methyltransferase SETMAR-like isoform X2 n=1 Tax=Hylaeus volcanicus TaxID=313075 RepID=UPI0023B829BC|nr:histone-lysine N-methyltransferase SETMAR-like isoform X2 [Hylaeus volcanicus]
MGFCLQIMKAETKSINLLAIGTVNMDSERVQIRAFILYEFKLGSKAANLARRICSVCGEGAVSERTAQKWFKRFKEGNESVDDEPRSGRPSVIKDEKFIEYIGQMDTAPFNGREQILPAEHLQYPFIDRILTCDEKWVEYDNVR